MSFKAILFINDEKRNILNASQVFSRFTDASNRPSTKPIGGKLEFKIESTENDDFFYYNMFSPIEKCNGEIVFYKRDGLSALFKMEFANAQILNLSEHFDANDSTPLHLNISIGWGIMKIRDVIFEERWNPSNPFIEIKETIIKQEEPTFLGYYFEDKNENKIEQEKIKVNDIIYLVIETENAEGDKINLNLNDDDLDYKYNGNILKNDVLRGIDVTGEITKIKLTAIAQVK